MLRLGRMVAALAGAVATISVTSSAYALSPGCQDLNAVGGPVGLAGAYSRPTNTFNQGEVITIVNAAGGVTFPFTGPVTLSVPAGQTLSATVAATGTYTPAGTVPGFSQVTFSCVAGPAAASAAQSAPPMQQLNNAQSAIANGQQTLQYFNDWISQGVIGSFGLIGGNPNTAARQRTTSSVLTARARLEKLEQEAHDLVEDQAERPDADRKDRLVALRRDIARARITADLASAPQRQSQPSDAVTSVEPVPQRSPPPTLSFGSREMIAPCESEEADVPNPARELLGRRWNVWLEGRLVGANDSLAQSNALGFAGSLGADYKVTPRVAVGLSLGVETFETKFSWPTRLGSAGLSAAPYVGVKLTDNVYASAFVGLTQITYNGTPAAGVASSFTALRLYFGGAVTGVWTEGPWRFQPSLSGTYGSENQYGYTDSAGNVVAGQTVTYGRLSAGPEVGYTVRSPDKSWSVEPFVLAKANLNFSSANAVLLNGQSVVLRPGTLGSGSAGLGIELRLQGGGYLRAQGTYDSIGVTGLDAWSALLRAGLNF